VAGCCKYGDEPSGSVTKELVLLTNKTTHFCTVHYTISASLFPTNNKVEICTHKVTTLANPPEFDV
jgi:hypothetical protein